MTDAVHFVGELENPHPLLNACDLFCLPSREDPFPLVMLEAGALGKPMVCFDGAGGAKEFAARGAGIVVPYLDVPAMAAESRGGLRTSLSAGVPEARPNGSFATN